MAVLHRLLEDARETDKHYQSWYSKVQAGLRHCCGRQLRQELENEHQLVKLLTAAAERIRMADKSKRKVRVCMRSLLEPSSCCVCLSLSQLPLVECGIQHLQILFLVPAGYLKR